MLSKVWDEITYPFPNFNGKYDNVSLVTKWGIYANAINTKLILSKRPLAAKWAGICREYIMTNDAPWKTVGNGCLPITLSWPILLLHHLCMACAAGISYTLAMAASKILVTVMILAVGLPYWNMPFIVNFKTTQKVRQLFHHNWTQPLCSQDKYLYSNDTHPD